MNSEKEKLETLLVTFLSGNASEGEKDHIYSVLSENIDSRLMLAEISKIWDATGIVNDIVIESDTRFRNLISRIRKSQKLPLKFGALLRYAAVIIFALSLGVTVSYYFQTDKFNKQLKKVTDTRIISPVGSKTNLILPDGTEVWINAGSTLTYSSSYGIISERKVILDGEAFFEVNENKKMPFIVLAHGAVIRAIGTSFNVKAYSNEPEIVATLVEGKISVSIHDQKGEEIIIQPNETLRIRNKNFNASINAASKESLQPNASLAANEASSLEGVILCKGINTSLHTSWKDNRWIIENEELLSLAKKLERKYAVNIQFKDEKLAEIRFTGILTEESLEQVLEVISFAAPIKYRIDGANVFLDKN
jgi:ferric-dicitrate binding protein FerR (iron transport regulator)